MDQIHVIRHKYFAEKVSVRRIAQELGVSRNTVRRYVEGAPVAVRAPCTRRKRPVSERVMPRALSLLEESRKWTTTKQKLTATRLHRMLRDEGYRVGESTVKRIVREWKRSRQEVFVPLVYKPGDLAEVDFFEVVCDVGGERKKAWMFVMRLMHSGRDFAWLYPRQDQVCFLDGHVRAFAHFGAVPQRIVYDNLKAAVTRVLVGSERELSARFCALSAHYAFEACFARPRTGHDKGGVEARGKTIRWQHLVPIPRGESLIVLSSALLERLDRDTETRSNAEGRTVKARFDDELERMMPLGPHPFRAASTRFSSASRRALLKIEGAHYSVWSRWAGLALTVRVDVDHIEITGPDATVCHPRQRFGGRSVDFRHYIPELARKPQAVRQVADELIRDLGAPFDRAWRTLVELHGPKQAARVFARVLQAVEWLGIDETRVRVDAALRDGEPLTLALRPKTTPSAPAQSPDVLGAIDVAAGRAADFDELLLGGAR